MARCVDRSLAGREVTAVVCLLIFWNRRGASRIAEEGSMGDATKCESLKAWLIKA